MLVLILVLVAAAAVAAAVIVDRNAKKEREDIRQANAGAVVAGHSVEYGSRITYNDLVSSAIKAELLYPGTEVSLFLGETPLEEGYVFDRVGKEKIRVVLTHPKSVTEQTVTWTVEDTQSPVISGVANKEITAGDALDIREGISASDPVDGALAVDFSGEPDLQKAGVYSVAVCAKDRNGNETTETFTVTVKEKPVPTEPPKRNNGSPSTSQPSKTAPAGGFSGQSSGKAEEKPSSAAPALSAKQKREQEARAEAKRVVAQLVNSNMDPLTRATVLCQYLSENVEAQHNQSTEAYKTNYGNEAYAALIMKIAACSGRCKAYVMLCEEAGLEVQHVNAGLRTHQWCLVKINGEWLLFDPQGGPFGASPDYYDWLLTS